MNVPSITMVSRHLKYSYEKFIIEISLYWTQKPIQTDLGENWILKSCYNLFELQEVIFKGADCSIAS